MTAVGFHLHKCRVHRLGECNYRNEDPYGEGQDYEELEPRSSRARPRRHHRDPNSMLSLWLFASGFVGLAGWIYYQAQQTRKQMTAQEEAINAKLAEVAETLSDEITEVGEKIAADIQAAVAGHVPVAELDALKDRVTGRLDVLKTGIEGIVEDPTPTPAPEPTPEA